MKIHYNLPTRRRTEGKSDPGRDPKGRPVLYFVLVCLFLLVGGMQQASAQLKGNYTIDPNKAASSTNYKSFTAVVSDLMNGNRNDGGTANGPGVSGAVVFDVADGTYTEQISIGAINGASAVNTVTFQSQSGLSSNCRLYYPIGSDANNNYTLRLNQGATLIFNKISIARTGTLTTTNKYGRAVELKGAVGNISFEECYIGGISTHWADNELIRVFPVSNSTPGKISIVSCLFNNGNVQLKLDGYQGEKSNKYEIIGSQFYYFKGSAIVASNINDLKIAQNYFWQEDDSVSSVVLLSECNGTQLVERNFINNAVGPAISAFDNSLGENGKGLQIFNNSINSMYNGAQIECAIQVDGNELVKVLHNSILQYHSTSATVKLIGHPSLTRTITFGSNSIKVRLGNFMHVEDSMDLAELDFNNYYSDSTAKLGEFMSSSFGSLSDWQAGTHQDVNSGSEVLFDKLDYHNFDVYDWGLAGKGKYYAEVPKDFLGYDRLYPHTTPGPSEMFTNFGVDTVCVGDAAEFNLRQDIKSEILKDSFHIYQYSWRFGDGDSAVEANPLHIYTKPGTYLVKLKIYNGSAFFRAGKVVVKECNPGGFDFSLKDEKVCIGDTLRWALNPVADSVCGTVNSYSWDFGDGNTSTLPNPEHVYANAGKYTIVTKLGTDGGCTRVQMAHVTVKDCSKKFSFTVTADSVCLGDTTKFVINPDQGSNCGSIQSISWEYGNGVYSSTSLGAKFTYYNAGTYLAKVIIATSEGCADTQSVIVKVKNCTPKGNLYITPYYGSTCHGDSTHFSFSTNYDTSCGNVKSVMWKFGDGDSSQLSYPKHKYAAGGKYTVSAFVETYKGCSASKTFTIYVDSNCVWPGDANASKLVTMADFLHVGLAYGDSGFVRANASSSWQGQAVQNWTKSFSNGLNHKHADCNGDGKVNLNDGYAILSNFGKTHSKKESGPRGVRGQDPVFKLEFTSDSIAAGAKANVRVLLGDSVKQVDSLYGLTFKFTFDPAVVDTSQDITVDLSNSWMGTAGTNLASLKRVDKYNGVCEVAVTRLDQKNVKGYGQIAALGIVIKDDVVGKNLITRNLILNVDDYYAISAEERPFVFAPEGDTLVAWMVGVHDQTKKLDGVEVYPNPSSGQFTVKFTNPALGPKQVELLDLAGRLVLSKTYVNTDAVSVDAGELKAGSYLMRIRTNQGIGYKVIVLQP